MRDDAGSGSLLMVMVLVGLMFVAAAAVLAGRVLVLHAEVATAADLAALAAARSDSCAQAERVAQANAADLASCVQDDADYQVVAVRTVWLAGSEVPVRATARAGY